MNCLTRFHWATEASDKLFYILFIMSFFFTSNCYLVIYFLTLKAYPTTDCRIQTKPPTRDLSAVLFEIINVNLEVFGHYALAISGINKAKSSLQVKSKQPSMGAHNHEQLLETFYPTVKILTETISKVRIGIVENLLAAILIPIIA